LKFAAAGQHAEPHDQASAATVRGLAYSLGGKPGTHQHRSGGEPTICRLANFPSNRNNLCMP